MATTYELMDKYGELLAAAEDAEAGGAHEEIEAAHEALAAWLDDDMPAKVAAILADSRSAKNHIAHLDAEAKAIKARKDRLKARIERNSGNALRLVETDGGKVQLPGGRLAHILERKTVSVQMAEDFELAELPEDLMRVSIAPDKTAIKKALQAGAAVPGCSLVESVSRRVSERNS